MTNRRIAHRHLTTSARKPRALPSGPDAGSGRRVTLPGCLAQLTPNRPHLR